VVGAGDERDVRDVRKLEQLLNEAREKNKLLTQENTQLKRQGELRQRNPEGATRSAAVVPPPPSPTSTMAQKSKAPLDKKLFIIVVLICLVLGYQLGTIF